MREPDDAPDDGRRDVRAELVRGFLAGASFFAGAAFFAAAAFAVPADVVAAFAEPLAAAGLAAAADRVVADRRMVPLDVFAPLAAFAPLDAFARGVAAFARGVAAFVAGAAFAAGAAFDVMAFAGAVVPALNPARRASIVATAAAAFVTWRCRRASSARASLRSRSAFAIERSRRACFAMLPPASLSPARPSSPDDPTAGMMRSED